MKVEAIDINKIKAYEKNAKMHTPEQIAGVAESIKQFRFVQPLVVDKNNVLVIGHCRFAAAQKLGLKEVPVVVADYLTDDQIKALRLADNKLNESYWDHGQLDFELAELKAVDIDMSKLGFTIADQDELGENFELPNGGKGGMQQITFTLTDSQIKEVKNALSEAMNDCPMPDESGNENKNGNAIFYICQKFLDNL